MNRRAVLTAAPALGVLGILPAAAADTPVMAMYREWEALRHDEEAIYLACPDRASDAAMEISERVGAHESRMMAACCQNPMDFVAKVIMWTSCGFHTLPDENDDPAFWADARRFVAA